MRKIYTVLAPYYSAIVKPFTNTKKEVNFLDKIFQKNKVKNILDVGCGNGRHAIPLSKLGYKVTGVDLSKYLLKEARKKKAKARFVYANSAKLPFKQEFDAAICMWSTFRYLPQPQTTKRVFRALRKNGIFVISCSNTQKIKRVDRVKPKRTIKTKDKKVLIQQCFESFRGRGKRKRIRKIVFELDGKKMIDIDRCVLLTLDEIKSILKKAGFKIADVYSDWENRKYAKNCEYFVIVSKKH